MRPLRYREATTNCSELMAKLTIREVAVEAGVSLGTASRVINRRADVNPEMKRRVERAIEKLGYTPNAVAQSMRLQSTHTIGILIRDFSSPAFISFANVAQSLLFQAGYVPLLAGYDDKPQRELEILNAFAHRRIDGLVVTTSSDSNPDLVAARLRLGVPTILFDRDPDDVNDTIAIEHRDGIKQAVRYLFQLGHRRVALLTGQRAVRPARERLSGFKEAFADAGESLDARLVRAGSFSAEFALAETIDLLRAPTPPTAIIAGGVNMLPGVLRGVRFCGLKVPDDVSVISSTNPEIAELVSPAITELRVDYAAIGRRASELMLGRLMHGIEGPPRVLRFDTSLIQRDSCGPPPGKRTRSVSGGKGTTSARGRVHSVR